MSDIERPHRDTGRGHVDDDGGTDVHRREDGGIITGWLGQLLVLMAILGVIGYDVIAVVTTAVALEDPAREVAVRAADAYGRDNDLVRAQEVAAAEAELRDVELIDVQPDGDFLRVRVAREAGTLWAHLIPPLRELTTPTASGRSNWRL